MIKNHLLWDVKPWLRAAAPQVGSVTPGASFFKEKKKSGYLKVFDNALQ